MNGRWRRRLSIGAAAAFFATTTALVATWWRVEDVTSRLDRLPMAAVWTDADGTPMLVRAADDGQIRLPYAIGRGNRWLELATIAAEDRRFRDHPGVDWRSVGRAAWANVVAGRVVEGASGLAMQTAKLLDPAPRTMRAKAVESIRAVKLVRAVGHDRVLEAYLTVAPFGGNRVGAEAASWAYFGRPTSRLTLAECALLAGLPKSPERLRPDRHLDAARQRRDEVLRRMHREGVIEDALLAAALAEPVTVVDDAFTPTHRAAALWAAQQCPGGAQTTIDAALQIELESGARRHAATFGDGIEVAVVAIDIDRAEIVALAVSSDPDDPRHGWLPLFASWRSPGSALKPFIYAEAFDRDLVAPSSRLADVELARGAWRPRNFDREQRGAVTVAEALRDSLNVPAIAVLGAVGPADAIAAMERSGIRFRGDHAHRAGLALAVGGAEVRLLDLTNAMTTIARGGLFRDARLVRDGRNSRNDSDDPSASGVRVLAERSCQAIDWILSTHDRVRSDHGTPWMAWKTGTSSGHRDAWAIGHNGRHAVGVWVGRPGGGGDPRLVGALAAEPLLVEILARSRVRPSGALAHRTVEIDWSPRVASALTAPAPMRRISTPRSGAAYLAIDGVATVPVRIESTASQDGHWLLDRRVLPERPRRLRLPPGAYELTFVPEDGAAETVRFAVSAPGHVR